MEGTENEVAGDEEYEEFLVIDAASDCEGVKVVEDEEDSGHDTRLYPRFVLRSIWCHYHAHSF